MIWSNDKVNRKKMNDVFLGLQIQHTDPWQNFLESICLFSHRTLEIERGTRPV